jgi:phospholipid/cholesterol/gamma-HCH transport system substrate-binding protein
MTAYQRNVVVGVVVLVGLGMLAWMILQFANKAASFFLTTGTRITLTTPRAEGIADGSPVTYKGVNVGRVTGVRRVLSDGGREDIIIDALINADPPLPANLHGRIKQTSLLGGSSMIALEPDLAAMTRPGASQNVGFLGAGANLQADFVPDVTSLTDSVQSLSDSAQTMINSINKIVGDQKVADDIRASLANARQTLENANKVSARLDKLGASFEKTADSAQATMGEVQITVKDARGEIKRMSDNLNQRLGQIAEALQKIQSVTQKIDQGQGTAGKLVNDPKLYDALSDTAAELKLTVKDLRRLIQQWEQEGIVKF